MCVRVFVRCAVFEKRINIGKDSTYVCVCEWKETDEIHRKSINYAYFAFSTCISFTLFTHFARASHTRAGRKEIENNLHNQVFNHCLYIVPYDSFSFSRIRTRSFFTFFDFRYNLSTENVFFLSMKISNQFFFSLLFSVRVFLVLFFHSTCGWQSILLFRILLWSIVVEFFLFVLDMYVCVCKRSRHGISLNSFIYGCIVLHTWFLFCILF